MTARPTPTTTGSAGVGPEASDRDDAAERDRYLALVGPAAILVAELVLLVTVAADLPGRLAVVVAFCLLLPGAAWVGLLGGVADRATNVTLAIGASIIADIVVAQSLVWLHALTVANASIGLVALTTPPTLVRLTTVLRELRAPDPGGTIDPTDPAATADPDTRWWHDEWAAPLRRYFETPLVRNAFALIGNTGITTAVGIVYWLAASHLYSKTDLSHGQALVNLMMLMAGIGGLGLSQVLPRLLPRSGHRVARRIATSYAVAAACCAVVTVAYIAIASTGAKVSITRLLGGGAGAAVVFVAAVAGWTVFTLQDAAMTGLRRPFWVPVENAAHSVAKLLLLVAFAGGMARTGVFASWFVPTLVALVPMSWLIFRRLVPDYLERFDGDDEHFTFGQLRSLVGGEYVGSLAQLAVVNLPPLFVLSTLGENVAGPFGVAWMMGTLLDSVVTLFGASLTVEGSLDRPNLRTLAITLVRKCLAVVVPLAVAIALGAPLILRLYGKDSSFADTASGLLRFMGVALLPRLVCRVVVVIARVQRRIRFVVAVESALAVGTLGTIAVLSTTGHLTPTLAGVAYLVTALVVALTLAPTLVRFLTTGDDLVFLPAPRGSGAAETLAWIERHVPEPTRVPR